MSASPRASVIVRAKDERASIGRVLALLRRQSMPVEIVVVDSGSTDGTVGIARAFCDRLIAIPPESFTYGHALNLGAQAASAPIHFALSAHCFPPDDGWVERSLAMYERPDVAATNGEVRLPDGAPLDGLFLQDAACARSNPFWGFSNHASSWRRDVWERFPFDEAMPYAEDKEWALRMLHGGSWVIAHSPDLVVPMDHRWRAGALAYFRRMSIEWKTHAELAGLPPYRLRDLARDWWFDVPQDGHAPMAHRFLNYLRFAGLAGRYKGRRSADLTRAWAKGT